jgi:hypothetical protein
MESRKTFCSRLNLFNKINQSELEIKKFKASILENLKILNVSD